MIRCPMCITAIRENVIRTCSHGSWHQRRADERCRILAGFDVQVARITFADRPELARHLVRVHGWKLRGCDRASGTVH